jgi:hypothetical protein
MKTHFSTLIFLLLVSPVGIRAQFRPAKCEVQPLWVGGGVRSSNFGLMGTFETDNSGDTSVRSFKLENTNLIATVGIVYDLDYSKYKLHRIRIAITVSDTEQKEIFESVDSSEARTQYRKGWNLAVTKNINFDNVVYMFTLRCWDSAARKPFL